MDLLKNQIQSKDLLKIKRAIENDRDGRNFIIVRTRKNIEYMRSRLITDRDVKNIVKSLLVSDCFSGPEKDRDSRYKGWIYKFSPMYRGEKLYIKIRVESTDRSICLLVHEFGKYDEVD